MSTSGLKRDNFLAEMVFRTSWLRINSHCAHGYSILKCADVKLGYLSHSTVS
jgi:hypothetical protein